MKKKIIICSRRYGAVVQTKQVVRIYFTAKFVLKERYRGDHGGLLNALVIRKLENEKKRKGHPIHLIGLVKGHISQIARNIRSPVSGPRHFIIQPTFCRCGLSAFEFSFFISFFLSVLNIR